MAPSREGLALRESPEHTPGNRSVTTFTERHWRNLLMDIEAGQVIPVVGPELLVVGEADGRPVTLYARLASELAARLQIDEAQLPRTSDLFAVSSAFLQNPANAFEDLLYETRDILAQHPEIPEPLRQLAAIRHFDLFVSITFDSLLQRAIDEVRFDGRAGTVVFAYSEKEQVEDLPPEPARAGRPYVFQLFGRLNAVGDYVISEDKLLEFSHRFQSRDFRPPNLFDMLRTKSLLTIGCGLPPWLGRFFLRAVKGDQLLTQGARGIIVDGTSLSDRDFVMFLQRRKTTIYGDGDSVAFVDELYRRWTDMFGRAPEAAAAGVSESGPLPEFKEDSVFLSYASQDRPVALRIKEMFDQAGVDVWFDQQALEGGDDYRRVIERNIESCTYFIPVISRHTVTEERRFFRLEWTKAIDEARFRPQEFPFIQPVLVDDTTVTAPGIPREFSARHCRRLEDVPLLVDEAKRRIRERRFERRTT